MCVCVRQSWRPPPLSPSPRRYWWYTYTFIRTQKHIHKGIHQHTQVLNVKKKINYTCKNTNIVIYSSIHMYGGKVRLQEEKSFESVFSEPLVTRGRRFCIVVGENGRLPTLQDGIIFFVKRQSRQSIVTTGQYWEISLDKAEDQSQRRTYMTPLFGNDKEAKMPNAG